MARRPLPTSDGASRGETIANHNATVTRSQGPAPPQATALPTSRRWHSLARQTCRHWQHPWPLFVSIPTVLAPHPDRAMRPLPLVVAGLLGLGLTACQKPGNLAEREQKSETAICTQLKAAGTALEQVAALKPTSTVGDAQAADQALSKALQGLEKAETQLETLRQQNFRNQLKAFKADVAKVAADKTLTLQQAAAELKTKAQPVLTAHRDLSKAVQCAPQAGTPSATPSTPAKP